MKKLILLFFITLTFICKAQNPGDAVQSFGYFAGFNSSVYSIAVQTDGKILLGGNFTVYNGVIENRIIRLNADGTKDTTFITGTGFNSTVRSIVVQTDGKILVEGHFTTYNGVTENRIIRLNPDGTKDTSFITGIGFNDAVTSITVQTDGKILVGGSFTAYNGVADKYIIRLNADGTKDTSFMTGTGFNGTVASTAVQTDGKILVGGDFTSYNGLTENRIIRLNADGTKDTSFTTGTEFNDRVLSIAIQTDGKILVVGSFTAYNGVTENRIIRLNSGGAKDTTFTTGTGLNNGVNSITLQTDGKILLGGAFTAYNGVTENYIIRLNSSGTKDTTFTTGTGFSGTVISTAVQTDGKILVGGLFTSYNGVTENRIIRLNSNGTRHITFTTGTGFNHWVYSIAVQTDGKILLGGSFTAYNGITENRIIRLNADGTKDNSFNTGAEFNNGVYSIAVQTDGKILVGGSFTKYNGISENRIIRLNADGTKDTSFTTGTGFNNNVLSITLQTDGKILVGGSFTAYNGVTENRIIRLNTDGTKDNSFITGTGFNSVITSITVQNDGKILVGGLFTSYNGITENRIIRLNTDGTKDSSFITGTGFNDTIKSIVVQTDGKILVGGYSNSYNGVAENFIIRLNTDGTKDNSFNTGTASGSGHVESIVVQTDEKILVGGHNIYNGIIGSNIIRLNTDGTKDDSFISGTGFNGTITSMTMQNDGVILVGGGFTSYKDSADAAYIIALQTSNTLSSENFVSSNAISLWPNPTNHVINLSISEENYNNNLSYTLFDMNGRVLQHKKISNLESQIFLKNLVSGVYLIEVKSRDSRLVKRVIKQ